MLSPNCIDCILTRPFRDYRLWIFSIESTKQAVEATSRLLLQHLNAIQGCMLRSDPPATYLTNNAPKPLHTDIHITRLNSSIKPPRTPS